MEVRHQVDDRDLLPRRVGLGRLYLYLFEVRDLLQLEGMRRAGERYDAAQHLVSERALCESTPYGCNWRRAWLQCAGGFDGCRDESSSRAETAAM